MLSAKRRTQTAKIIKRRINQWKTNFPFWEVTDKPGIYAKRSLGCNHSGCKVCNPDRHTKHRAAKEYDTINEEIDLK